jgi:hypothetical protein
VAAGVQSGVKPLPSALPQDRPGETGLEEGLPSRQRHAAAGMLVEGSVLAHVCHDFIHRDLAPKKLPGIRVADADACSTLYTPLAVVDVLARRAKLVCLARTGPSALATPDAPLGVVDELRLRALSLRVVTPDAAQRASLEEDHGADAGAIVHRETLQVEDGACKLG